MTEKEMVELFRKEIGLPETLITETHPTTRLKDANGQIYEFNRWCLGVRIDVGRGDFLMFFSSDKFPKVGEVDEIPK